VSCIPQNETVLLANDMGMLKVVMLAMMERMLLLGMKLGMQMDLGSGSLHTG